MYKRKGSPRVSKAFYKNSHSHVSFSTQLRRLCVNTMISTSGAAEGRKIVVKQQSRSTRLLVFVAVSRGCWLYEYPPTIDHDRKSSCDGKKTRHELTPRHCQLSVSNQQVQNNKQASEVAKSSSPYQNK